MARSRQRDHTARFTLLRARRWRLLLALSCRRRSQGQQGLLSSTPALVGVAGRMLEEERELGLQLARRNRISVSNFSFNFNALSDGDALREFRFRKQHVLDMVCVLDWPEGRTHTRRNRFSVTPLLSTCVILRRMATPARWKDLEYLFGKHASQLSEVFWEAMEVFLESRLNLITSSIDHTFMSTRAPQYAESVYQKTNALQNCVGFIDGTVIGIARPKGFEVQRVAYNGHKRKHALKYQAISTPDGLILHVHGPTEGRRHDWTLYTRSGLDESLPALLDIGGVQYCIFGDSDIVTVGTLRSHTRAANSLQGNGRSTRRFNRTYFR
eukprot:IDg2573t1